MNTSIFNHDNKLWVVHRAIHSSKMTPKNYGFESQDTNKMVKVWVEWLRDNCKNIEKVWLQNDNFLFCEEIKTIEEIKHVPRKKKRTSNRKRKS